MQTTTGKIAAPKNYTEQQLENHTANLLNALEKIQEIVIGFETKPIERITVNHGGVKITMEVDLETATSKVF